MRYCRERKSWQAYTPQLCIGLMRIFRSTYSLSLWWWVVNRLYYLSISPDLYPSAAEGINTLGRPGNQDAWLRVVLEKPFGRVGYFLLYIYTNP